MARRTVRAEGFQGLYRGVAAIPIFAPWAGALYYAAYKLIANTIERRCGGQEHTPPYLYFACGVGAELAGNCVYIPYEVVKQRLQVAQPRSHPSNALSMFAHILATGGVRGVYAGALATYMTYIPFSGLYLGVYEWLKASLVTSQVGDDPLEARRAAAAHFGCAVGAGSIAAAATQPIDVIKTRLQVRAPAAHVTVAAATAGNLAVADARLATVTPAPKVHPTTMIAVLRDAIRREGWGTLVRGTYARVFTMAPLCGISMMLFEHVHALMLLRH